MRPLVRLSATLSLMLLPIQSFAAAPSIPGIPNFHQVNDRIYRGAQPLPHAWDDLAGLGVKTVIDLRRDGEHSIADEKKAVEAAGMRFVHFPMNGFDTPTSDQMAKVIALMEGPDKVFVHCKLGRDRTGTVIAAWRIQREQWENEKAVQEAKDRGMAWYNYGMRRFLRGYKVGVAPEPLAPALTAVADSSGAAPAAVAAPATP